MTIFGMKPKNFLYLVLLIIVTACNCYLVYVNGWK